MTSTTTFPFNDHYVLRGRDIFPCKSREEFYEFFESDARRIARVEYEGGAIVISTVFLGVDHAWRGGQPVLFETMIFGGEHNDYQKRCCTYDEAERMHAEAVALVGYEDKYYRAITEDD